MSKASIKSTITWITTAISVGLVGFVFVKSLNTVDINYSSLFSPDFIASFFVAFVIVLGGSMVLPTNYARLIHLISNAENHKTFIRVVSVYCKTQIFKYLPGNVFHFVGRQLFLKELSFRQPDIANTTLGEILGLTSSAALICIILGRNELQQIISNNNLISDTKLFLGILAGLIIGVSSWLVYFLRKREITISLTQIVLTGIFYTVYFLATSIALWIILKAFEIDASFGNTTIIFVLAWLIGFVTPGASAGIGLREAAIFTLGSYLLDENLSLAAMILRLITVMGDVGQWLVGYGLEKSTSVKSKSIKSANIKTANTKDTTSKYTDSENQF